MEAAWHGTGLVPIMAPWQSCSTAPWSLEMLVACANASVTRDACCVREKCRRRRSCALDAWRCCAPQGGHSQRGTRREAGGEVAESSLSSHGCGGPCGLLEPTLSQIGPWVVARLFAADARVFLCLSSSSGIWRQAPRWQDARHGGATMRPQAKPRFLRAQARYQWWLSLL